MGKVSFALVSLWAAAAAAVPRGRTALHFGGRPFPVARNAAAAIHARRLAAGFPPIPNRTSPKELLIGTKTSFPFSFAAGTRADAPATFVTSMPGPKYSGYSWELFDEYVFPTARDSFGLNYTTYRIVPFDTNAQMLQAVALGLVDAGHAAITKTAARSEILKFSTGWFDTGLAVVARTITGLPIGQALGTVNSVAIAVLNGLALLATAILAMAFALFILERAAPGPRPVMRRGCVSGVCDSASLITQILAGVGVRMPSGRLSGPVTTVCSISSAILTIVFTALATVALQSAAQHATVTGFDDLSGKTVVMPRSTTAEAYVRENGVGVSLLGTATLEEAMTRFAAGDGDAMVYDKPILTSFVARDQVASGSARFAVVGSVFERQQYGVAFDKAMPDSEINAINKAILAVYGSDEVAGLRQSWLGQGVQAAASSSADSSVTDFLTNNFWSIAFMVGVVVGTAMVVGMVAFTARTVASMMRRGDCSLEGAYRWSVGVCSGSSGPRSGVRRNRKSVVGMEEAVLAAQQAARRRRCGGCCQPRPPRRVASVQFELTPDAEGGTHAGDGVPRGTPALRRGASGGRGDSGDAGSDVSFLVDGDERRRATHKPAPSRRRLFGQSSRHGLLAGRRTSSSDDETPRDATDVEGGASHRAFGRSFSDADGPVSVRAGGRNADGFAAARPQQAWSEPRAAGGSERGRLGSGSKLGAGDAPPQASARSTGGTAASVGLLPDPDAVRQSHSFMASGQASALLGKAVAAAASHGASSVGGVPMASPGASSAYLGLTAPSDAGTAPLHAAAPGGEFAVAGGTLSTEERLFLKHEQWAFRLTARTAPVLPPNDLLWLIWERVDKLTQQALLQRAMGRLDVPADLEEVSPEDVEAETKLLAEELEARGVDPKVARRAALAAAMVGATDDDETQMQAALSSDQVRAGLKRAAEAARQRLEDEAEAEGGAVSPRTAGAGRAAGGQSRSTSGGRARRKSLQQPPTSVFLAATEDHGRRHGRP